ncbi:SDR family oxidoreductase [Magnetospira sp. QH-2]|uniref:SDR family oxidoreductase n=1 Tax=Magnetospira sp. (strain QH-2) TaxID=1288970 RepID=UPI0003E8154E|nr:NAD(P)H-binding protein [Magnetospira sp. QH-2]CCQ75413.1 putative NmrA family protein [Magnetospira sp. QH-2]
MKPLENTHPVLVLGGNGKTGRRVMDRLRARGREVLGVSRSTTPAFDWNDPASWPDLLEGVSAVYMTYQPDLAVPGALDAVRGFTDLALKAGVRRLVLLSGRGEEEAQRAERMLQDSDADWTIVRAAWFNQNFSENFLMDGVLAGKIALPAGRVQEPFVDVDDIAEVVVEALCDDRHIGQLYEVTGPRLMTFAEVVAEIGTACGREVSYEHMAPDDYAALLRQHQLPADFANLILYLVTTVLDGRNAYLADGVQRALGRPPKDFSDYAREVAAQGAWSVVPEPICA